jgi:hypothetical protein
MRCGAGVLLAFLQRVEIGKIAGPSFIGTSETPAPREKAAFLDAWCHGSQRIG